MIEHIEDFISPSDQNILEEYVKQPSFPYRFHKIHNYGDDDNSKVSLQLTHHLMMYGEENTSPHIPILKPILNTLIKLYGDITLFRAKVNCTFNNPYEKDYAPQEPHTDLQYDDGKNIPHLVCLYYINDSDGPTYFYDGKNIISAIEPKKGSAVVFDGSILHAGSNPVKHPFRFAFNINFRKGSNQIP